MAQWKHLQKSVATLLKAGLYSDLAAQFTQKAFGTALYVDVVLDLARFRSAERPGTNLTIRPIEAADEAALQGVLSDKSLPATDRLEASRRIAMLATGLKTCYVVCDSSGNARYMQWLILPSENESLRRLYGSWYPQLEPEEALFENAFVFPAYRGTGIFPPAFAKVIDLARESGVKRIVSSIISTNVLSLRSFASLGFRPTQIRIERRSFGRSHRMAVPYALQTEDALSALGLPGPVIRLMRRDSVGAFDAHSLTGKRS